jgi:hypothetical protein
LQYRAAASYSEQVERYFDVFGRSRVLVVLFDDFRADTEAVYRQTLEFLGVRSDFRTTFERINPRSSVRNPRVGQFVKNPPVSARLAARMLPKKLRDRLRAGVRRLNSQVLQAPVIDPALRSRLRDEFAPDVKRLSRLINRDLSSWLES